MKLYPYTGNYPSDITDSNGNCPWCLVGALAGAGVSTIVQYETTSPYIVVTPGSCNDTVKGTRERRKRSFHWLLHGTKKYRAKLDLSTVKSSPRVTMQTAISRLGSRQEAHTYSYDSENRLVNAAVAGSTTTSIYYDYDALGRRISKTVGGIGIGTGGTTTQYLLDGDEEIAEYIGATLLRQYITGPGVDDRIAHAEGNATSNPPKTYDHTNHEGSVMDVTRIAVSDCWR